MPSLMGRAGPLQAPRLLAAVFVLLILFFYFKAPADHGLQPALDAGNLELPLHGSNGHNEPQVSAPPDGKPQSPGELPPGLRGVRPEKESMSDRFLDYLKGHGAPKPSKAQGGGKGPHASQSSAAASAAHKQETAKDATCASLPDLSDVLVVVRTPAADLYNHLPAHFLTDLRCVDFLLYSTVQQRIGPHDIYDALTNVSDSRKSRHKEFELYERMRKAQMAVADLSDLKEDSEHNLDRWTILPHVVDSYKRRPAKKWYVFIESDTYLSVSNLAPWLQKMDPSRPIYAGAPVMIGDVELAHSGSGIVLSNAAVAKLAHRALERGSHWEEQIGTSCCGDKILAEALADSGVRLHRSFPMIQGETPFSLDWSERHWCRPAITWHRMSPQSLDMMWQFESSWISRHAHERTASSSASIPPMRFKDYFQMFLIPLLRQSQNRTDWDNLANSLTYTDQTGGQYAHYSFDSCRAACDLRHACVQYAWEPNKCRLGTVVHWGEGVDAEKRMMSGWLIQRVEKFGQKVGNGKCEEEDVWILPGEHDEEEPAMQKTALEPPKEPVKDALQIEEEQVKAKAAEEERAKAEEKARELAEAERQAKEKAMADGNADAGSSEIAEKEKSMMTDTSMNAAGLESGAEGESESKPESVTGSEPVDESRLIFDKSKLGTGKAADTGANAEMALMHDLSTSESA